MLLPLTGAASASASSTQKEFERTNDSAAGGMGLLSTVTWTIHFRYWNASLSTPANTDLPGARVELWRGNDWLPSTTSYTSNTGYVTFSVDTAYSYKAKLFADDSHTNKVTIEGNALADPIYWWTDSYSFTGSRSTNWNITSSMDRYQGLSWYCNVRHAHRWLESQVGYDCPLATTYGWAANTMFHYTTPLNSHLQATGGALTDKNTAYHEFSHWVMWKISTVWADSSSGHAMDQDTTQQVAYCEGWAEFFECMVDNEPNLLSLESGPSGVCWAENPIGNGDRGDWDGAIVEGAVAQTFWDMYDGTSSTDKYAWSHSGDNYQAPSFASIFNLIDYYDSQIQTILDFYAKWIANYNSGLDYYDLKTVLDTNRIVDWNGDRLESFESESPWECTKSASGDPNPTWITCAYSTTRSVSPSHSLKTSFTSGPMGYDTGVAAAGKTFSANKVPKISVKMYVSAYSHNHGWSTEYLDAGIRMKLYNSGGTNYATYTYWLACWYGSNDYRTNPDPSTIKIVYNKPTMNTWLNPVVYPTQDFPSIAWGQCTLVRFELYFTTSGANGDQFEAYYDDFTYSRDTVERTDNYEVVDAWPGTWSSSNGDYSWLFNTYSTTYYYSSSHSISLGFSNGPVNYDTGTVTRYMDFSTGYVDTVSLWMYVSAYQHNGGSWDTMDSGVRIRLYDSSNNNYATYTYWLACWYHSTDDKDPSTSPNTVKVYSKPTLNTWLNPVLHPNIDFNINWNGCTKVRIELYSYGSGAYGDNFRMYLDNMVLRYALA